MLSVIPLQVSLLYRCPTCVRVCLEDMFLCLFVYEVRGVLSPPSVSVDMCGVVALVVEGSVKFPPLSLLHTFELDIGLALVACLMHPCASALVSSFLVL
jgi:hypothetical protein